MQICVNLNNEKAFKRNLQLNKTVIFDVTSPEGFKVSYLMFKHTFVIYAFCEQKFYLPKNQAFYRILRNHKRN